MSDTRFLPRDEFYRRLPKKAVGAGTIFFNDDGHVLIVKPNYKEGWLLPGGSVDAFESPLQAAIRETREELGLVIPEPELVCVSYRTSADLGEESLQFIFHGGTLSVEEIASITLQEEELDEYRFVDPSSDGDELPSRLRRRLAHCVEAIRTGTTIYLEDPQ